VAHSAVGQARFDNLLRMARQSVSLLPWGGRLQELALDPALVNRCVARGNQVGGDWNRIFDAFVGHWVGGDLHDADRGYQHIWHPATVQGDVLTQPVMMIPGDDEAPIWAYNFACTVRSELQVHGVVGPHALVGFLLEEGALLWVGEQPEGWTSVHAERVWARGQLYDIRGLLFRMGPDGKMESIPSDWRYHRVAPGAITLPLSA